MKVLHELKTLEADARTQIEKAQHEKEQRIAKAKEKAAKLIEGKKLQAMKEAQKLIEEARKEAKKEAKKILASSGKKCKRIEIKARRNMQKMKEAVFEWLLNVQTR